MNPTAKILVRRRRNKVLGVISDFFKGKNFLIVPGQNRSYKFSPDSFRKRFYSGTKSIDPPERTSGKKNVVLDWSISRKEKSVFNVPEFTPYPEVGTVYPNNYVSDWNVYIEKSSEENV